MKFIRNGNKNNCLAKLQFHKNPFFLMLELIKLTLVNKNAFLNENRSYK